MLGTLSFCTFKAIDDLLYVCFSLFVLGTNLLYHFLYDSPTHESIGLQCHAYPELGKTQYFIIIKIDPLAV